MIKKQFTRCLVAFVGIAALAPTFRLLTRGAELASDEEKAANPRATPVRIRAVERVRDAA